MLFRVPPQMMFHFSARCWSPPDTVLDNRWVDGEKRQRKILENRRGSERVGGKEGLGVGGIPWGHT